MYSVLWIRVVSPEIFYGKFIYIFPKICGKFPELFFRNFPTTANLRNNCAFADNDTFQRFFTAPAQPLPHTLTSNLLRLFTIF